MTCPDIDLLLADGLDVPAETRAHVAACPACSADLAAAMALAAGFAEMRAETAPSSVVDAALAAARTAPAPRPRAVAQRRPANDRTARRPASRQPSWRVAAGVLAAAVVVLAFWLRPSAEPEIASIAAPVEHAPAAEVTPRTAEIEPTLEGEISVPSVERTPDTPPSTEATRAPSAPPSPGRRPAPAVAPPLDPTPTAPIPTSPAPTESPTNSPPDLVADAAPALPDSVAAARDGALLAFGLVADAQRAAGRTVANEIGRIGSTLSDAARSPHSLTP